LSIKNGIEALGYCQHDPVDFEHYIGALLDDDQGYRRIEQIINEYNPALIVIDNLRAFHRGDENDSRVMDNLAARLHHLHQLSHATLLVVHHLGKAEGSLFRRLRGSTALLARCDSALEVRILQRGVDGQHVQQIGIVPLPRRVHTRSPFKISIANDQGRISFAFAGDLRAHEDPAIDRIAHLAMKILPRNPQSPGQGLTVFQVKSRLGGIGEERQVRRALHHLENIGAADVDETGRSHAFVYVRLLQFCPWCGEDLG
jgi:hypothetical protein